MYPRLATSLSIAALVASTALAEAPTHRRLALLVGCTHYSNLGERYSLQGPANDVALVERLLRERFRFAAGDVVRLLHTDDEAHRPTRANILREFARLADQARPGDEVVILLAGHGSQLPDDNDDEDDGLDEAFLSEDVTRGGAAEPIVGIRDDEIERTLTAVRDRGAFVFFIADTCHSGTMSRGPEEADRPAVYRHVASEELTSPDVLRAATAKRRSATDAPTQSSTFSTATTGGLAAVYAVPSTSLEQEHPMPPPASGDDEPRYGRLTYSLCHVLAQAERPMSYRELAQQVAWQYRRWEFFPYPLLEGTALDREVLGKREWRDRSALLIARDERGRWLVNQGSVHGLTQRTLLKVLPPAGDAAADQVRGYVVVKHADPFASVVEPVGGAAALPNPGRCEIAEVPQPTTLSLRIVAAAPDDEPGAETLRKQLLAPTPSAELLIEAAPANETADAHLTVSGREARLRLRGRSDATGDNRDASAATFGPYPLGDAPAETLLSDLRRVAVVFNLLRLAAEEEPTKAKYEPDELGLKLQLERADSPDGPWTPVAGVAESRFTRGAVLRLRLTNVGVSRIDATVLYIDASLRIQSLFPTLRAAQAGSYNTIAPEQTRDVVMTINDKTTGWEDILVLAVVHQPPAAANFAFLEQPGLTRDDLRQTRSSSATPLDALLEASLGGTRSTMPPAPKAYAVRRIPLDVYPWSEPRNAQ